MKNKKPPVPIVVMLSLCGALVCLGSYVRLFYLILTHGSVISIEPNTFIAVSEMILFGICFFFLLCYFISLVVRFSFWFADIVVKD